MQVRKKLDILEAFRFGIDAVPEWFQTMLDAHDAYYYDDENESAMVKVTRDKQIFWLEVYRGDVIVKDAFGIVYPVEPAVFGLMFEVVER